MQIAVATSDAGPANYLSAIIKHINKNFLCFSSVISSRVFDSHGIKNTIVDAVSQNNIYGYISNTFSNKMPCLIITGTSWGNCIDKAFMKFGIENSVSVISAIEHWSWYKERFMYNNNLLIPDYILVNDETAKKEAVESGLPGEILYPLGNPALEQMANRELNPVPREEWLKTLSLPDKKIVAFISEQYGADFPEGSNLYQGFDEFRVIEDILSVLKDFHHLLIKAHPSEKLNKYNKYPNNITIIQETDTDSLISNSSLIIGMGSIFLLEAAMHRSDIISYRPGDKGSFIGNKIGATSLVKDKNELENVFVKNRNPDNTDFKNRFNDSTRRIINFVEDKLR